MGKKLTERRLSIGKLGEGLACEFLRGRKFTVVETNYRVRAGEVDIIAVCKGEIHFVEVKTRRGAGAGMPIEHVTPRKQQQIVKAARHYLAKSRSKAAPVFSVLGITLDHNNTPNYEWIDNAFGVDADWAL